MGVSMTKMQKKILGWVLVLPPILALVGLIAFAIFQYPMAGGVVFGVVSLYFGTAILAKAYEGE
jgi:uncharacterized membrane protein